WSGTPARAGISRRTAATTRSTPASRSSTPCARAASGGRATRSRGPECRSSAREPRCSRCCCSRRTRPSPPPAGPPPRGAPAPPLWEDEGDTVVFARQILATGLPTAWDGRTFLDSDFGFRVEPHALGRDFVMVGTPWLPFYVTAGSFAVFGESERAARLPFAL